jgi:single-stranded-DNA-specific exonuclease
VLTRTIGENESTSILGEAEAALADPRIAELQHARAAVDRHPWAAVRAAPQVGDAAALIRLDVPAKVHSQVAVASTRRLAGRVVVAANAGWRAGKVSFAVRSAHPIDLRAWLSKVYEPPPDSGDYARGHARATGGSLTPGAFEGFAAAVLAAR